MPQSVIYTAVSVDGYIADEKGTVAFLEPFQGEEFGYDTFFEGIGAVVMGRKTYDQLAGLQAWPYRGSRAMVLTNHPPLGAPDPGIKFIAEDVMALNERLSDAEGDIWVMGGADVMGQYLKAGLISRVELFVIPATVGSGVPMFVSAGAEAALKLVTEEPYPKGVIKKTYEPT